MPTFSFSLRTLLVLFFLATAVSAAEPSLELKGSHLHLTWSRDNAGWRLTSLKTRLDGRWTIIANPSGAYVYLYATNSASVGQLNRDLAGGSRTFFPERGEQVEPGRLRFTQTMPDAEIEAEWSIDPQFPTDIRVRQTLVAKRKGVFSQASPTLAVVKPDALRWGLIPGAWYGRELQPDYELATSYSWGIPNRPALSREVNTMTLCALLSTSDGVTLGVSPDPGTSQDPWPDTKMDRATSRTGLSLMNRHSQLSPTAYSPLFGMEGSRLETGDRIQFSFRYLIQPGSWFDAFRHVASDLYRFSDLLKLQTSRESLSDRISRMQTHLQDEKKSRWNLFTINGQTIGAYGSKTSDVGAMYMVSRTTHDPILVNERLPLIRSFKLQQQEMTPGFFQHAAIGEYPVEPATGISVLNRFVSEMGNWVEPLYTTKYTMLDVGNILLFNPGDQELRERIRLAAERLLAWQHPDGGFDVAYDRESHELTFPHLQDLRPTWYGFLVAYRILGDKRYLAAARKGADWFVKQAVERGFYLGACGDSLNKWDFTTAQSSQTLLDLYDTTGEKRYRDAAIEVAKAYATSVFTHPIPTREKKRAGSMELADWELTQVGLGVEHIRGTASGAGPIYLASHAGLFVRIYELTREPLFLEMARAAARGRSASVDVDSGMGIYYWRHLDDVPKNSTVFPWHAWWQIGWITDYLLAEAQLRTEGAVTFPRGFVTPKVGPHQSYGFAPGKIHGREASLWSPSGLVTSNNPNVEYVTAKAMDPSTLFVVLLNQMPGAERATIKLDPTQVVPGKTVRWQGAKIRQANSEKSLGKVTDGSWDVTLSAWGVVTLAVDFASD